MNKNPILTTYKTPKDLIQLREWFYNFSPIDLRSKAISRVNSLAKRGKLPHFIESTALLTSCLVQDTQLINIMEEGNKDNEIINANILQLSYAMSIIKFVNGTLDKYQQSTYAIPLYHLAKQINLSTFFVELRHMGTHESLPSLEILRVACREALSWLFDTYWASIEEEVKPENDNVENEIAEKVKIFLKDYKRLRLKNLDRVYKFGDSSEGGLKYWEIVNYFRSGVGLDSLINVFIQKLIISKKIKIGIIMKLYEPLVNDMSQDFHEKFLIGLLNKYKVEEDSFKMKQITEWCLFLVNKNFSHPFIEIDELINILSSENNEIDNTLLAHLLTKEKDISSEQLEKIHKLIDFFKKFELPKLDFLNEKKRNAKEASMNYHKRVKLEKNEFKFFEVMENWEPKPFGVI